MHRLIRSTSNFVQAIGQGINPLVFDAWLALRIELLQHVEADGTEEDCYVGFYFSPGVFVCVDVL